MGRPRILCFRPPRLRWRDTPGRGRQLAEPNLAQTLTDCDQIPITREAEFIRQIADRGGDEHGSPEWLRQFLELADQVRCRPRANVGRL
jgi:hypothetical protein